VTETVTIWTEKLPPGGWGQVWARWGYPRRCMPRSKVAAELESIVERVEREHVIDVRVRTVAELFSDPEVDPFEEHAGSYRAGVVELGAALACVRRLPDELTVRVLLPSSEIEPSLAERTEAAVHRRASNLAAVSWRDAMAVRSMGRRETPLGVVIALVSAAVAYASAYGLSSADTWWAMAVFAVVAGLGLTVAWVVAWVTIEAAVLDWRQDKRAAEAYELLAEAHVELVPADGPTDGRGGRG